MPLASERAELEKKIRKYRQLARLAPDLETSRCIKDWSSSWSRSSGRSASKTEYPIGHLKRDYHVIVVSDGQTISDRLDLDAAGDAEFINGRAFARPVG